MTGVVNWAHLASEFYAACLQRHMSARAAGHEMGVHPTQLCRLRRGTPLSAANIAALLAWLYPDDIPAWITTPDRPMAHHEPPPA